MQLHFSSQKELQKGSPVLHGAPLSIEQTLDVTAGDAGRVGAWHAIRLVHWRHAKDQWSKMKIFSALLAKPCPEEASMGPCLVLVARGHVQK